MELVISSGQILIGPMGEHIVDGAVLVRDGRIAAVGPEAVVARLAAPPAVRRRFPDSTMLPGLIDCHVHLAFDAGPDPVGALVAQDDLDLVLAMAGRAGRLLRAGVTTVRDLGDRSGLAARLKAAVAARTVLGPRILVAGAPLTPRGGHCWFLGGEVDGIDSIRRSVRRSARAGTDVIKIMATGGRLTPGGADTWESQFTTAEIRAAVEEAHMAGLRVAAHAHGTEGIARAVEAGVDTIEHCSWFAADGVEVDRSVVEEIVQRGIQVSVTVSRRWRELVGARGWAPYPAYLDRIGQMDAWGVDLVLGTDAGLSGAVFDDITGALEGLRHAGLAPGRILELVTVSAARALGLEQTVGRVRDGFAADLLIVRGDPLVDLGALQQVQLVVAAGRPYPFDPKPMVQVRDSHLPSLGRSWRDHTPLDAGTSEPHGWWVSPRAAREAADE